jgi:hypothetical protein
MTIWRTYKGKRGANLVAGGGGGIGVDGSPLPGNLIEATNIGVDFSSEKYGGYTFSKTSELLIFIRDTLTKKGWEVENDPLVQTSVTFPAPPASQTVSFNAGAVFEVSKVFNGGTYVSGTDYSVNTTTGTITRLGSSSIPAGGTVTVQFIKIPPNLFMIGKALNGDECFIEFVFAGNSASRTMQIIAWDTLSKANRYPNNAAANTAFTFDYTTTFINRIWLIAKRDAAAITIYRPVADNLFGIHFGFLTRIDSAKNDTGAWMIGTIDSRAGTSTYVCIPAANSSVRWRQLSSSFSGYMESSGAGTYPIVTFDQLSMVGMINTAYNSPNTTNYGRNAFVGRINYNGKHLIAPYYYIEGENTPDYGPNEVTSYYRGSVFACYTGGGLAERLEQLEDVAGNRYLSVKGNGGQLICLSVTNDT